MDSKRVEELAREARIAFCHAGRRIPPPYPTDDLAFNAMWEAAIIAVAKSVRADAAREAAGVCWGITGSSEDCWDAILAHFGLDPKEKV